MRLWKLHRQPRYIEAGNAGYTATREALCLFHNKESMPDN